MPLGRLDRARWSVPLVTVVAVLPALAVLIRLIAGDRWYPAGDMAQAELHMRGFPWHPPLVGAAGRIVGDTGIQGSHPGPALWFALLPVYIVSGRSAAGLMTAVVSVHVAAIAWSVWLARRRAGIGAALAVGAISLMVVRSAGPDFMIEPWNPWLAVLPFMVFLLLLADVVAPVSGDARRRWRSWVGAIVLGSYCVQCHAGYLLIVGFAVVAALGVLVVDLRRAQNLLDRHLAFGAGALFMMWLPPLVDQIRRSPGNLSLLWQHFGSPSEPTIGLRRAIRVFATEFNVVGPWMTGPGASAPSESFWRYPGCAALIVLLVGAWWRSRRRGMMWLQRLILAIMVLAFVGFISVARIFGPFFEYTIRWFWIVSALAVLVVGQAVLYSVKTKLLVKRTLVALMVVFSVSSSIVLASEAHLPGPTDSRIVGGIAKQVRSQLSKDRNYLVRFWDPYTLNATGFGLVLELERDGFKAGVEPQFSAAALPHRVLSESTADEVLWVVVGPSIEVARTRPELTELAYVDPRTGEEQDLADLLLGRIKDGLVTAGRPELVPALSQPGATLLFVEPPLPDVVADDVRDLILLGQPVAVFAAAPGSEVNLNG